MERKLAKDGRGLPLASALVCSFCTCCAAHTTRQIDVLHLTVLGETADVSAIKSAIGGKRSGSITLPKAKMEQLLHELG